MPRNKYPEETIQKILDSALEVFLEKGFEQTTILDIVDGMGGLTRGAFYHHFKSKEEVLDVLCEKLFFDNNPFEKVKQQTELNGLEKLKYLLSIGFEDTDYRKLTIKSIPALKSPAFLKKQIDDNRDVLPPMYQELIEEGVMDGSIKTEHPKLLAELFTILTNFWMVPTIYPSSEEESKERFLFVKEIIDKLGLPIFDDELVDMALINAIKIE